MEQGDRDQCAFKTRNAHEILARERTDQYRKIGRSVFDHYRWLAADGSAAELNNEKLAFWHIAVQ
jgi:hypothetical protein